MADTQAKPVAASKAPKAAKAPKVAKVQKPEKVADVKAAAAPKYKRHGRLFAKAVLLATSVV